jgi:hypothetical protein
MVPWEGPAEQSEAAGAPRAWRLAPLALSGLPSASQRSLPDPSTSACELCELSPERALDTVLVIDGPDGLPVPFLICEACRRALDALSALLESAAGT